MTIYVDGHASTVIAPEAMEAMIEAWRHPGNPHGANAHGSSAAARVEKARAEIAALIRASPTEIVFTSGATEANNIAILGLARALAAAGDVRRTIVTSALDHPSVMGPAASLAGEGFSHLVLAVSGDGRIALEELEAVLAGGEVALVSITAADGEIGALQPLEEIGQACRAAGVVFHCDASQAAGRIPLDVDSLQVDAMTVSSHKMHGPAGIGALYLSAVCPRPLALTVGGGQERAIRPGTVPVGLAAGFGVAAGIARARMAEDAGWATAMARRFLESLRAQGVDFRINGPTSGRLPGSVNIQMPGVDADALVDVLSSTVALSTNSACSSGQIEPSQALRAAGLTWEAASSSFRLVFDRYSEEGDPDAVATSIVTAAKRLKVAAGDVVQ